ncbi:hypothetical protein NDU88_006376 [Pleurodeles waltl]|uniref:Uncharacterized protein n=1 Tax=Pleurodeles waltl TaxID=8319 RepID=A0AAV7VLU0_PLEWA|nr:hypothetical protein NDU88_006376 [Pleurodeles waltl]
MGEAAAQEIDANLTLEEIRSVLACLLVGKTHGSDGFTAEFYQAFTTEITQQLLEVYLEAREQGDLPRSIREGCIAMVLKPRAEASEPSTQCPLTMINKNTKVLCGS